MRIESLQRSLADFPDLDGCWQPDNLAWTEENIRSLLSAQPESGSSRSIELLSQLARVLGLRGDLTGARVQLGRARELMLSTKVDSATELRYLLEYGRILSLDMSPKKAAPVFLQAWDLATQSGQDFFAIDASVMLSTILPPKLQGLWVQRAIQLVHRSERPETKLWLGQLNLRIGWQAYDLRRYEEALQSFDAALIATEGDSPPAKTLPILWSKARTLRALGRVSESLALQTSILERMQALGMVNGHVYLELAECAQLKKDHEQARTFFELAHTALSSDLWYKDNRSDELDRMKYIFKKRH
ncbi:MAG: hypothetical protein HC902_11305 [Calothrix sp. SM1_5_4]|nr:hypothetical protein [Calothrix sp. SM1_5_4]